MLALYQPHGGGFEQSGTDQSLGCRSLSGSELHLSYWMDAMK